MTGALWPLYQRELRSFLVSPWTYLAGAVFAAAAGVLALPPGRALERIEADPMGVLRDLPWLLAGLGAALGARVWARERRRGALPVLLAAPTPTLVVASAKLLAAWTVTAANLLLLAPLWIAIGARGTVDWAALLAANIAAALLCGVYAAVGAAGSALAEDEPRGFAFAAAGVFALTGLSALPAQTPAWLARLAVWSPAQDFETARLGVLEASAVLYWVSLIALFLWLSVLVVESRRGSGG